MIEEGHCLGKAGPQTDDNLDQFVRTLACFDAAARDHFNAFGHAAQAMGAKLSRFALQCVSGRDERDGIAFADRLLDCANGLVAILAKIAENPEKCAAQFRPGLCQIGLIDQFCLLIRRPVTLPVSTSA